MPSQIGELRGTSGMTTPLLFSTRTLSVPGGRADRRPYNRMGQRSVESTTCWTLRNSAYAASCRPWYGLDAVVITALTVTRFQALAGVRAYSATMAVTRVVTAARARNPAAKPTAVARRRRSKGPVRSPRLPSQFRRHPMACAAEVAFGGGARAGLGGGQRG